MNIQITIGLACFAAGILAYAIWQKLGIGRRSIKAGDIVLYVNPTSEDEKRNMVTSVLSVFPGHQTAIIRYENTTAVVRQDHLQVLDVDRRFPLLIPSKPYIECVETREPGQIRQQVYVGQRLPTTTSIICSPGNRAGFEEIPLSWLRYTVVLNDSGEVCIE